MKAEILRQCGAVTLALAMTTGGCGSDAQDDPSGQGTGSSTTSGSGASGQGGGTTTGVGAGGNGTGASGQGGGGASDEGGGGTGGSTTIADPDADGPYGYASVDATVQVAATNKTVPVHAVFPTSGPSAGPYPVVVIAHGFQLPASQYYGYATRLASFGYVALAVDYEASFLGVNNVNNAKELLGAVDWAASAAALGGKADTSNVGMTGHSMGGKLALLATTMDPRVKASITLDPVDASQNCSATDCPDVSALMPVSVPTGFLGETLDASGGFQPCAPASDNFETFYASTSAPSLSVTVNGANHVSFVDDVASCGFTCSLCKQPTLDNATVNGLSKGYVVAFYERYLRGNTAYDTYLTGAEAKSRYVDTGLVTLASK